MFITGSDSRLTQPDFENLAITMPPSLDSEQAEQVEPVLVLFQKSVKGEGGELGEGSEGVMTRELEIGCIKTAAVKKVCNNVNQAC